MSRLRSLAPRLSVAPPKVRVAEKRADPFYLTPEWRGFVCDVIRERGRRCETCGKTREDDGSPVRLIADHIVEISDGGAVFDKRNIGLKCTRAGGDGRTGPDGRRGGCHNRKTAEARAARMGGAPAR
jgi:hypothetical protein